MGSVISALAALNSGRSTASQPAEELGAQGALSREGEGFSAGMEQKAHGTAPTVNASADATKRGLGMLSGGYHLARSVTSNRNAMVGVYSGLHSNTASVSPVLTNSASELQALESLTERLRRAPTVNRREVDEAIEIVGRKLASPGGAWARSTYEALANYRDVPLLMPPSENDQNARECAAARRKAAVSLEAYLLEYKGKMARSAQEQKTSSRFKLYDDPRGLQSELGGRIRPPQQQERNGRKDTD